MSWRLHRIHSSTLAYYIYDCYYYYNYYYSCSCSYNGPSSSRLVSLPSLHLSSSSNKRLSRFRVLKRPCSPLVMHQSSRSWVRAGFIRFLDFWDI
jgi:hypothetical protein